MERPSSPVGYHSTSAIQPSSGGKHSMKREHEDVEENGFKKQKVNGARPSRKSGRSPMVGLQRGLEHVVSSGAFAEEVLGHAQELLKLLFNPNDSSWAGYVLPAEQSSAAPEEHHSSPRPEDDVGTASKNPHTNVPPPFAIPDPRKFIKGPTPQADALNAVAPMKSMLPNVPSMSADSMPSPITPTWANTLPAAPEITDISLANAPYMHTSALPAYVQPTGTNSYEHLEFLGDAYLEVIATRLIHARFPLHSVGQKAGLRELLVKNETLAEYSRAYQWGERVQCTQMDRHGSGWMKILADVFEAYLACIIIQDPTEQGFLTAERWLTELWAPKILQWRANGDGLHDTSKKADGPLDPKTDLNRLLVGKESRLEYREEKPMQLIKDGNRTVFFMGVYLTGWGFHNQHLGSGEGRSKQVAGSAAAEEALRSSQDIIQLAHSRKTAYERQFKKAGAIHRAVKARGGRGGELSGPHNYSPAQSPTHPRTAAYGAAPPWNG